MTPPVTPPRMGESLPHIPLAGAEPRDGACGAGYVSGSCRCWSAATLGISVGSLVLREVRSWAAGTPRVVVYNSTGG
jgi:hypothetical protein